MSNLSYQIERRVEVHEVAEVYRRSGISRPIDDLARLTLMLQNANLMISARDQGQLVGFARALTDFSYCCYVSDLAVDRDYQRQGIGKQLLHTMRQKLGDKVMVCLLSAPEAMSYYPKTGFLRAEQAWWIPRER
jgi:predicted N-acetyltransferase YhbS